jgi:hypothetical protein
VLEVLLGFVDFASGRCDPALDTICAKARLARATVVRAIEALKEHGFLDKVRRTRRTGRGPTEGPQREQISNAYAFATRLVAAVQQRFAQLVGGRQRAEAIQAARRRRPPSGKPSSPVPGHAGQRPAPRRQADGPRPRRDRRPSRRGLFQFPECEFSEWEYPA